MVLRRSPDLLNNVKCAYVRLTCADPRFFQGGGGGGSRPGQGQLQLIIEQILFYRTWGLQTFWSSDLNNLMNNPSNSPVISEKQMF